MTYRRNDLTRGRAGFNNIAGFCIFQTMCQMGVRRRWPKAKAQSIAGKTNASFAPACVVSLKLTDGQGVKEFIGHQPERSVR